MCGFTYKAILDKTKVGFLEENYYRDLSHRGPDGKYIAKTNFGEITFFRLAIRDIYGGKQPYVDTENGFASAINGELYNEQFIRKELNNSGFINLPTGDMNLAAFYLKAFGIENISKLDGMFAGLIEDFHTNTLYLFRDAIGEKPLYYKITNEYLYVSSEMPKENKIEYELNLKDKNPEFRNIMNGVWPYNHQLFSNFVSLAPGSYLAVNLENKIANTTKYWGWPKRPIKSTFTSQEKDDYLKRLRIGLEKSIESRLISDVPVATLLSGGIDSGLITAVASRLSSKNLTSFTLDFKDSPYSEIELAKCTARHLGIKHEVVSLRYKDLASMVPRVLESMDVPIFDTAALSMFALSQHVSEDFKVALSGDGGDELFMGYELFRHLNIVNIALKFRTASSLLLKLGLPAARIFGNSYLSSATKIERGISILSTRNLPPMEAALSTFAGTKLFDVLNKEVERTIQKSISHEELESFYRNEILPKIYLVKADRMSMCHGLEIRSPFLAPDMISLANEVSASDLLSAEAKYPLRILAREYLPKEVIQGKKHGFSSPFLEIKKHLNEPKWNLCKVGIPCEKARQIWRKKSENAGFASWSLMVLNHFIGRLN